jgi:hypothetical protein
MYCSKCHSFSCTCKEDDSDWKGKDTDWKGKDIFSKKRIRCPACGGTGRLFAEPPFGFRPCNCGGGYLYYEEKQV